MTAPQPRVLLFSRHEGANSLIVGLDNGVPFVEVTNAGNPQRTGDGAPIAPGTWRHLAIVAKSGQIALYVDGNPFPSRAANLPTMTGSAQVGRDAAARGAAADSTPAGAPATAAPATAAPATPGAAPAGDTSAPPPAAAPAADAAAAAAAVGFVGGIDGLQVAKVARPAGFIKLAAIGQGTDQAKLISFSVGEGTAGWVARLFAGVPE